MDSKEKMQQANAFMQQHSLTPDQRYALILEKFKRVQQYAQAQRQNDAFELQKREILLTLCPIL